MPTIGSALETCNWVVAGVEKLGVLGKLGVMRIPVLKNPNRSHYMLLLLSLCGSFGSLLIIHMIYQKVSVYAVNLLSVLHNVISIYFLYQLFDGIESEVGIKPKTRILKFALEFIKLFVAIFITTVVQFYWISRPIFKQNYDPNFFFIIIVFSIPAAALAWLIFQLRQAQESVLQSRLAQAEAQYNLLETQMQPHFLFNSLNVLSELIYVDPDLACSVTQQLADLYREILHNSKQKFSNLGSEISILKKYIQIQKIRFGDRIRFKCDVGAEFFDLFVPSLILQTLVENAIKHGISPRQEGGDIEITVTPSGSAIWSPEGRMFEICVSNSGELYRGPKNKELGTGLQNTKNRLDLFYGHSHGFTIYSDDKKTYVRFRIPANPGTIDREMT